MCVRPNCSIREGNWKWVPSITPSNPEDDITDYIPPEERLIDHLITYVKLGDQWLRRFEMLLIALASNAEATFPTLVQMKLLSGFLEILNERNSEHCSNLRIASYNCTCWVVDTCA
jgi:hypothetical protein